MGGFLTSRRFSPLSAACELAAETAAALSLMRRSTMALAVRRAATALAGAREGDKVADAATELAGCGEESIPFGEAVLIAGESCSVREPAREHAGGVTMPSPEALTAASGMPRRCARRAARAAAASSRCEAANLL